MGMGVRSCAPLLSVLFLLLMIESSLAVKKSYVVYLGGHLRGRDGTSLLSDTQITDSHYDLLGSFVGSNEKAKSEIFYSYTRFINGFAANLEEEEAVEISKHPSVISVFPNRAHKLHTTHSWEFLGLERDGKIPAESLWKHARYGEDVIIGNLDTGVWPESESFHDEGMGPVPSKWKGICQADVDKEFKCNRKLIGARYFNKGYQSAIGKINASLNSPRDTDGHGSHTLSTVGGRFVPGVKAHGFDLGTAKGGSPHARVAAYKVCWPTINEEGGCYDADMLAAFEAAIHDGVDVLSVSIGGNTLGYLEDSIAIGSFHAVQNGITVVCSAGNEGPGPATLSNTAPWILNVAASTIDREFPAYVSFNKKHIKGQSVSPKGLPGNKFYPMISGAEARAMNVTEGKAKLCLLGALDPEKVRGKIIVCLRGENGRLEKGEVVHQLGAVGMILANDISTGDELIADAHVLPASHISYSDGLSLFSYLKSTKSPQGYITKARSAFNVKPSPIMAAFSSQGPNHINPEILKPDITAPGVSVVAATGTGYEFMSGTSMSCPHISGIVGLLKTLHPYWSPPAIRSAIMTTATIQGNTQEPIYNASLVSATPFSYGAGHVQANRAMIPGLIYDMTTTDYLLFLCAIGYNSSQISTFSIEPFECPTNPPKTEDLNYPSIGVHSLSGRITVTRKVRNVGSPGIYKVWVKEPAGVSVTVYPTSLEFKKVGEEKKFEVTLEAKKVHTAGSFVFGELVWSDSKHYVRSPIVVQLA